MNQEEKEYIARFILDARDERGVTVLLIEHHMDVVTAICDRMMVLSYGEMHRARQADARRSPSRASSRPTSASAQPHASRGGRMSAPALRT